mmetsp:Transcript_16095/g.19656  ORF Transcript_16095/g.19656 Transcript_16095/m.19656 type:complete len:538 (+) Transcript_16095:94-1707(+)
MKVSSNFFYLNFFLSISIAFTFSPATDLYKSNYQRTKSEGKCGGFGVNRCNKVASLSSNPKMLFSDVTTTSPYQNRSKASPAIKEKKKKESLRELCQYLKVTPLESLYLGSSSGDGERGVYLNQSVRENDTLMKIPLSSCIRDDSPPTWYDTFKSSHRVDVDDDNFHYNPSKWATRLAASLFALQTNTDDNDAGYKNDDVLIGQRKWLDMMPDEDLLHASLPVHWSEDIISYAKCTALELSVDQSYFAREETISNLISAIHESDDEMKDKVEKEQYDLEKKFSNALDIVQTRSCRVERLDGLQLCPSLRVLAPIFDFINHGSRHHYGEGSANAYFGLEGEDDDDDLSLVVRARRDIEKDEEVIIDYGASARPAWRCLSSYGFVPNYRITSPDDELDEDEDDESVAEVFMEGGRYEVGSHSVPSEMVEAAYAALLEQKQGLRAFEEMDAEVDNSNGTALTPDVALRIAKRVSDVAFQLLIDPSSSDEDQIEVKQRRENDLDPKSIAEYLAASLRRSQHQVLLACAIGLRDYAARSSSK